jgi:hypothetical protein
VVDCRCVNACFCFCVSETLSGKWTRQRWNIGPAPHHCWLLRAAIKSNMHWYESCGGLQVQERRRMATQAAADKAEKKLLMAQEELTKAQRVMQFDCIQAALADRFRFDPDGAVSHEHKEGEWVVRYSACA